MSELRIKSVEFRKEREKGWRELEQLLDRAESVGLRKMNFRELSRLPVLYRGVLSSLSVARAISLDRNVLDYLESLASRAYFCVYGVRRRWGEAFAEFLVRRFPQELRAYGWMFALAAAIFLLGGATGFLMTTSDLDNYYQFVSAEMAQGRTPTSSPEELRDTLFNKGSVEAGLNLFASFLFTHNAQIGILCFALGFAAGIPVFYLLFTNGQALGAVAALFHQRDLGVEFWSWILPHGVTELTAVVICGAAGLVVARALILPGRYGRLRGLAHAGRRAGIIALGAVVMFLIAAGFEGYFRQLVMDVNTRYAVAAIMSILWFVYFTQVGKRSV